MKTWLITGCSSGIGRGIAKAALEKGYNVVVTARNIETVKPLADEYPDRALAAALDVTDKESIAAAVGAATKRFGGVDALVNNAGYGYRSAIEEGEEEDIETLFKTNLFGPVELIKAVLPQMRERKSGAIINLSSIGAVRSAVGSGYYSATKAALELLSDALKKEAEPLGIKVMIVEPGAFHTRFFDTSLKGARIKIDDYAETAGKNRKENIVNKFDHPGDPEKAGRLIVDTIEKDEYPERLLMGSDAVEVVGTELRNRLKELERWETASRTTDFLE